MGWLSAPEYQKVYQHVNKKKLKIYKAQYYIKHKKKIQAVCRQYYLEHKAEILKTVESWRKPHKEKCKEYSKKYHQKLKVELIEAYGGKCSCCGETEQVFLTIDHINGGGVKDRKEKGGREFYKYLKELGYPKDGYRLLCMNCNFAFRFGKLCPHQEV